MSRRSFLLLEVMLCMSLVSLALFPLVSHFVYFLREEVRCLEKKQVEPWLEKTYMDAVHLLYENLNLDAHPRLHWEDLGKKPYEQVCEGAVVIHYPRKKTVAFQCSYLIEVKKECEKVDGTGYRLLNITVKMRSPVKEYTADYPLVIQKGIASGSS